MKILPIGHLVKANPIQTQSNPILSAVGGLQMNVNSLIIKDYRKKDDFAARKNKPNFFKDKMNVHAFSQKDYDNETAFRPQKYKPNQSLS